MMPEQDVERIAARPLGLVGPVDSMLWFAGLDGPDAPRVLVPARPELCIGRAPQANRLIVGPKKLGNRNGGARNKEEKGLQGEPEVKQTKTAYEKCNGRQLVRGGERRKETRGEKQARPPLAVVPDAQHGIKSKERSARR